MAGDAPLQHLQELDLSLTNLSDNAVPSLKQLVVAMKLQSLDVSATRVACETLLNALAQRQSSLQELRLQFLPELRLATLQRFLFGDTTKTTSSSTLDKLRILDVSWAHAADERTTPKAVCEATETFFYLKNQRTDAQ